MAEKILITTRSFRKLEGPHQQMLRDAGYEIINSPYDHPASAAELADLVRDVVAVIMGVDDCTAEVIDAAESLRVISRYGVGLDNVDLDAATAAGVVVTNTPGANTVAVAELTLALLLALARHVPQQHDRVRAGSWSPVGGVELAGETLGLIGLGRIGREVARRAAAFDMRILYHDPVPPTAEITDGLGAEARPVDTLLAESDFVSLHLPLTPETRNLIDREALARMKPGAFLVNTARGGLVDETALYEALTGGRLAGAAFDVLAQEPPADSPLLKLENVIVTPHTGSATRQTTLRMGRMASANALAVMRGERPEHVVNPDVYGEGSTDS